MTAHPKQHEFLSNDRNKSQFIDLLKHHLSWDGHNIKQSEYDADTLIVKSSLDLAHSGYVTTVVADDTDILVLLLHHYRSTNMADIFLLSLDRIVLASSQCRNATMMGLGVDLVQSRKVGEQ